MTEGGIVAVSDAELIAEARRGDPAALAELYTRHHAAALRVARSYRRAGDPDDLVSEAFARVLGALERGAGPDEAFRAYLFVTLRRVAAEQIARSSDEPMPEVPEPVQAEALEMDPAERQVVLSAYESLPDRWQSVLWQTAVEGRQPRELATTLGISGNAASALAYRAREKLRQAYLQAHLQADPRPDCEPHRSRLGAYVRDGLSRRDRTSTEAHLGGCDSCRGLVVELADVNGLLARSLFPVFSSASQAGVVAVAGGAAVAGGGVAGAGAVRRLASRARSHPAVVAATVVAIAAAAAAMGALVATQDGSPERELVAPVQAEDEAAARADEGDATPRTSRTSRTPGASGTPGTSGTSGTLGASGTSGTLGASRTSGTPGASGASGTPGASGTSTTPGTPTSPPRVPLGSVPPGTPPPDTPAPHDQPAPDPAPGLAGPQPPAGPPAGQPPPSTPPPPPPPATTTPPPPPEPDLGPVVWFPDARRLQVTLSNPGARPTDHLVLSVRLTHHADVDGRPTGCRRALELGRRLTCAIDRIPPGGRTVVQVPLAVDRPGQKARVSLCAVDFLSLDCDTDILEHTSVDLTQSSSGP